MAEPPAKRQRLDLSETITIVVGKENNAREFRAYKNFVTRSSSFIRAAMNPNWKEAHEKRITILDHDPATFEGYLNWVYSERITLRDAQELYENCTNLYYSVNVADCLDARSLDLVT